MAAWKKAVLVVLMTVIGTPLFVQVGYARMASVEKVSITLPQGAELSNKELSEVYGELISCGDDWRHWLIGAFVGFAMGWFSALAGADVYISVGVGFVSAMAYWASTIYAR